MVIAAVVMAVGGAVWFAGWWQAYDQRLMEDQISPLNVATLGLVVIGVGQAWWFLRGRRAVADFRRVVLENLGSIPTASAAPDADMYIGGPGARFYHRAECAMVTGRGWTFAPRAAHHEAGRTQCGVCRP